MTESNNDVTNLYESNVIFLLKRVYFCTHYNPVMYCFEHGRESRESNLNVKNEYCLGTYFQRRSEVGAEGSVAPS